MLMPPPVRLPPLSPQALATRHQEGLRTLRNALGRRSLFEQGQQALQARTKTMKAKMNEEMKKMEERLRTRVQTWKNLERRTLSRERTAIGRNFYRNTLKNPLNISFTAILNSFIRNKEPPPNHEKNNIARLSLKTFLRKYPPSSLRSNQSLTTFLEQLNNNQKKNLNAFVRERIANNIRLASVQEKVRAAHKNLLRGGRNLSQ